MSDNNEDVVYAVFRVYSRKERNDPKERQVFYGWSNSKQVIKVFMKQRSPDKYRVVKLHGDDRDNYSFHPEEDELDSMIDFVKLKSAANHEEVLFFSTLRELREAEIKIQERFHEMCSIPDERLLTLYQHIDPYYLEALEVLGFRPKEIDMMYDTSDPRDNYNTLELVKDEIDNAYYGVTEMSYEEYRSATSGTVPGLSAISQIGDKILYSFENFVTALRDDL